MTRRAPYIGDVLLDPPRWVIRIDREKKTFETMPLDDERFFRWEAAPIEPGWTELPP